MAISKCPKCDNTYFEVAHNSPSKSNYKLMFVQCSKCGAVVGTMDYYNIGTKIEELEKKVENLSFSSDSISTINNNLSVINQNVSTLFNMVRGLSQQLDKMTKKDKPQQEDDTTH